MEEQPCFKRLLEQHQGGSYIDLGVGGIILEYRSRNREGILPRSCHCLTELNPPLPRLNRLQSWETGSALDNMALSVKDFLGNNSTLNCIWKLTSNYCILQSSDVAQAY